MRGNSSHNHNPFVILKRPDTDEFQGEAIGFSLIYSGNFLAQAEVDTYDTTRVLMGIHPSCFDWKLEAGESFQTPEAVMVYTDQGLNHLSQTFHRLYQNGWQEGTGGTGNVRFLSITGKRPVSILQRRNCWKLREQQKKPELNCSSWMMAGSVKGAMNTPVWGIGLPTPRDFPRELQVFPKNRGNRNEIRTLV